MAESGVGFDWKAGFGVAGGDEVLVTESILERLETAVRRSHGLLWRIGWVVGLALALRMFWRLWSGDPVMVDLGDIEGAEWLLHMANCLLVVVFVSLSLLRAMFWAARRLRLAAARAGRAMDEFWWLPFVVLGVMTGVQVALGAWSLASGHALWTAAMFGLMIALNVMLAALLVAVRLLKSRRGPV